MGRKTWSLSNKGYCYNDSSVAMKIYFVATGLFFYGGMIMKRIIKRIMKRILSLVLIISICFSNVNIYALAEDEQYGSKQAVFETETYKVIYTLAESWNGGYNAKIRIENISDNIIENWYIGFYSENTICNIWNAQIYDMYNNDYIIKNMNHNQDIPVNGYIEFGFSCTGNFSSFPDRYEMLGEFTEVFSDNYSVEYILNSDWGTGFVGTINITNTSDKVIEDWLLEIEFDRNITNIWNANISFRDNEKYTIKNAGYNSNIEVGQTVSFGFCGDGGCSNDKINNSALYTYDIDNVEFIKLSDGNIEKSYLYNAIYPSLILKDMPIDNIMLSDDYDNDKLSLEQEYEWSTNPFLADTDEDGLSDYDEINIYMTSPVKYDSDDDGMGDGTEINCGLNPLVIDSDGDGIEDSSEVVTQNVVIDDIVDFKEQKIDTIPSVQITGKGDYSPKMYAIPANNNYNIMNINSLVGTPFEFVHDEEFEFEESKLSFTIDESILEEYDISELSIAYFDDENNILELIDTTYDEDNNIISANVEHYSIYMVVSSKEYFYNIDLDNASGIVDSGKADVVFVVDTTSSMEEEIEGIRKNIGDFVYELSRQDVDIRLGLVEYKDIYEDGIDTTKSYGWYTNVSSFEQELSKLGISGGGDVPESVVDALNCARHMKYRNGVNKYIILVTDANYKNGNYLYGGATIEDEIEKLVSNEIVTSVITLPKHKDAYMDLINSTGGLYVDINSDFATSLNPLIKMMKEINEGCWIRLGTGDIVCLDKDPTLGDDTVDTDNDGIPDIIELTSSCKMTVINPHHMIPKEIEVWMCSSNPVIKDTDGDSLLDVDDIYPSTYDSVVEYEDEKSIEFISGRVWNKVDCTAYDYFDNAMQIVDGTVDNPMSSEEFQDAYDAISDNSDGNFSLEELEYIGIVNNEGAKLYLNEKSGTVRTAVFEKMVDRSTKFYQHKGILWWVSWEEVSSKTESSFWGGTVLSEADINLSCKVFFMNDVYTVLDGLVEGGALVLTIVLIVNVTPVIISNIQGLSYYVKNFGVKQGLDMYLLLGINNLPNGVISWLQQDVSDGDSSLDDLIGNEIPIHERGLAGEQALFEKYSGKKHKYFETYVDGVKGARYVDVFSKNIAYEAKVGYTCLSKRIKMQVLKDAYLLKNKRVSKVVWEFYRSDITGRIGASKQLLELLDEYNIKHNFNK